jgi:phage-related minor tail protein
VTALAIQSGEFAAWTAGALAVIGILAALGRIIRAGYRAANRLERIEKLATELAPNHGGSIKDVVHRLETKVDDAAAKVETAAAALDDHAIRLARAEGRIEAIAMVTSPTMLIEDEDGLIREAREHGRHH